MEEKEKVQGEGRRGITKEEKEEEKMEEDVDMKRKEKGIKQERKEGEQDKRQ